jgi:arylsulfatase A-like enzyme
MRCPLIIAGPGVPPNTTTQSFTYLLDLYPTLCQIAKTKSPENLAGHSLQSLWTDPKAKLRPNLFMPFQNLMRSINDGRHKLIVYPQINRRQLFDLQADPHETTDLITDTRQAFNLASLQALLSAEQKAYGDKQPLQVTNPQNSVIRYDDFDRKADQWQPRWIIEKYFPKP